MLVVKSKGLFFPLSLLLISCMEPSPSETGASQDQKNGEQYSPPYSFQQKDTTFCWNEYIIYDTLIDHRDSSIYRIFSIGSQVWMAENLRFSVLGSWCYFDNKDSCRRYGRLYNWTSTMGIDDRYLKELWNGFDFQIQGICPSGWHLPSDSEWDTLIFTVEADPRVGTDHAGAALKFAPDPWARTAPPGIFSPSAGRDFFGFRILPGGSRWSDTALYSGIGTNARFWSSTEGYELAAYGRAIYENKTGLKRHGGSKASGFSIRCVQD